MFRAPVHSLGPAVLLGAPARPVEANSVICIEGSTSRDRGSIFSYAVTGALRQRKHDVPFEFQRALVV